MEEQFVTYDIAKILKELGFEEPCIACYDKNNILSTYFGVFEPHNYNKDAYCISAPIWQEVIGWILKEYDIYAYVAGNYTGSEGYCGVLVVKGERALKYMKSMASTKFYSSPEKAREDVILKFIEIIKKPKG